VRLLQRIYHLVKEQGFTLEGARQKLKEDKHQALSTLEMITKLEAVKQQLLSLKDAL
jgi:transcriptional regulator, merR family